ncbi:MAG: ATP-binding protein [Pseudomonadota bacterium]|nr:ATP-binding protein [Pseudomonadota bacterium]
MLRAAVMLWALLLGTAVASVPEKPLMRMIGVADGLPSSTVLGLARDHDGYLWIATADGLARYDGVGMRVWRHSPEDPGSLPGNYVTALHIDARNRVWVAIEARGMSVLGADRRSFRHYRKDRTPGMASDDVWAIASRGDDLWFGTFGGGLHRMPANENDRDPPIQRFMPVAGDPRSMPSETVTTMEFDSAGRLWVGTQAGVAYWDGRGFERVRVPGTRGDEPVSSVNADGDAMWIHGASGLHRREASGNWSPLPWSAMFGTHNAVFTVAPDADGHYWIGGISRLWRLSPGSVPTPVSIGTRGPAYPIYQVLQQGDGAVWIPVPGVGLGYLRPDWRGLAQFTRAEDGLADSLYRNIVSAAAGGVWLSGYDGELGRLDREGKLHPVSPPVRALIKGHRPLSIAEDRLGRLWMGRGISLVRLDLGGELREWRRGEPDGPLGGQINLLQIAPDGTLWMLCSGFGIQQRDPATGKVLTAIPAGASHGIGVGDLEAMKFDHQGVLWVAGADGLARLDRRTGRFGAVPGVAHGDRVFGFAFDGPDALWLQRLAGLERYARRGQRWVRLEQVGNEQGIPNVEGSGLEIDERGRVWLPSLRGLFRWDPRTRQVRRFGLADGLSSHEFVDRGTELTPDGVLASTLSDGDVVLIDTSMGDLPAVKPALLWDRPEVRRDGRWVDAETTSGIVLGPDDRELRVQLRLLAFDDVQANRYFTRLDGYDRQWIAQGANGERILAGLPPGNYTLRASALDAAGNSASEQVLHFTVQPPWWRTPGALLALALVASLLLAGVAIEYRDRLRRRHAVQRSEHEREVSREASLAKTRFLATLGHEVRTPMTGVLGMSELLLGTALDPQQRGYTESIRGAGEHLLRLVNDALDLARIESGKLELSTQPFDLHALVAEVVALTAPLAQQRGLGFECEVEASAPRAVAGDSVRVRQILLNLIGNAVKFTERGKVVLRLSAAEFSLPGGGEVPHGVVFQVSDTGPGLNEEQCSRLFRRFEQAEGSRTAARYGGSGLGLAICQELARAMGGRIDVDSAPGAGTRFSVSLPLPPAELPEPAATQALPGGPGASLKLLLVEDDPTVAEVVVGLLRAQGHRVTHAAHGLAAMTEVATCVFDGALLDLDLPGFDGFALARQLRLQGFTRPLIAITARADADAEPHAMEAGFDSFVRKPVTGTMLMELLEECFDFAGEAA